MTDINRDKGHNKESWKWHGIAVSFYVERLVTFKDSQGKRYESVSSCYTRNSCSLILYSKERGHFLNSSFLFQMRRLKVSSRLPLL